MRSLHEPALMSGQVLYPWVPRETRQKRLLGVESVEKVLPGGPASQRKGLGPHSYAQSISTRRLHAHTRVCVCVFRRLMLPSVDTYKDRSIEDNHSRTRDGFPKNDFLGDTVQIFPGQMLDATFC